MRAKLAVSSIVFGLSFGLISPASAELIKAADNMNLVAGEKVEIYQCSMSMRPAELHYRLDRTWIRLTKSKVVRDSTICKDKYLPVKHIFKFTVPAIYQSIEPTAKYQKMLLRTVGQKQPARLFTATVFRNVAEKEKALGPAPTGLITDWSKCLFNGQLMIGRVKVVSYDATYRVQLVQQNPNLVVTESRGMPTTCGSWHFVNQNYDFSIQLVNESPDFTIAITKPKGPRP